MVRLVFSILALSVSLYCNDMSRVGFANHSPELKVLVLIIASEDRPVYPILQQMWRSYMHSDPDHFECYLIKGNDRLEGDSWLEGDVLWTKTAESYVPGILNKTILSMEALMPRVDEFDYLLRTNLSSFYIFPRFLEFLKNLPREKCYSAFVGYLNGGAEPFGAGAGFIVSRDVVKLMVQKKGELIGNISQADDVVIARFLRKEGLPLIVAPRTDFYSLQEWKSNGDNISSDAFEFRIKDHIDSQRLCSEPIIQSQLIKRFYNIDVPVDPKNCVLKEQENSAPKNQGNNAPKNQGKKGKKKGKGK